MTFQEHYNDNDNDNDNNNNTSRKRYTVGPHKYMSKRIVTEMHKL